MIHNKPYLGVFGKRLFLILAVLSLFLAGSLGLLGFLNAKATITRNAEFHLSAIAHNRAKQIEIWFGERKREICLLVRLPEFIELTQRLGSGSDGLSPDSLKLAGILQTHREVYEAYGACGVFDTEGRALVLASTCPSEKNRQAQCVEYYQALESGEAVMGNIYMVNDSTAGMNLAKSIIDENGETAGVLMLLLEPENTLNELLANHSTLGETGETYIVGADTTMLTPSRSHLHPMALTHKMPTEGVLRCLSGLDSSGVYENFLGNMVVGAYVWIAERKWALMAEMTLKEAYSPLRMVAMQFIIVLGAAIVIVFGISIFISRYMTLPLFKLADASGEVARGNLDLTIKAERDDEIGQLAAQFSNMVKSLKSSRRKIEQSHRELIQAEKLAAIGRLVASTVHEMRNPLSGIKMNIRILQKKLKMPDLEKEHLNIAAGQTVRLEKMLNELLEYSKPITPQISKVDLNELLPKIIADLEEIFIRKNLKVEAGEVQRPVFLDTDPDLFTRIIDNILTNAVNASSLGKSISIRLKTNESLITIEIADEGKGMSEKDKNRIFEAFFTTREEGVGLGMNNVKKFVDILGGTIEVDSAENSGTTIILQFNQENYYAEDTNNR
ncbi:MAG: sensor histidine kinase [FCB group bacterium]|nr:sensor histidine kinase [FCB group bacterium]